MEEYPRFGRLYPDSCPRCDVSPYPHGVPCHGCGLIGERRESLTSGINAAGLLRAGLFVVGVLVITLALAR